MANATDKSNLNYGIFVFALVTLVALRFFLSNSAGILTQGFYEAFYPATLAAPLLVGLTLVFENIPALKNIFFYNEKRKYWGKFTDPIWVKIAIGLALAFIWSVAAIGVLNAPIIDIPQPFSSAPLSEVTFFDDLQFKAIQPGLIEEIIGYIYCSIVSFMLIFLFKPKSASGLLFIYLIAAASYSPILMQGHRIAYGNDQEAYIGLFVFETTCQFANMVTGSFISWIPHISHNAAFVITSIVAFSIGGTMIQLIPILRRKKDGSKH